MKKITLSFVLLVSVAFSLSAQDWFKDHPHWANYFSFGFAGTGAEYISVQGDTVLQGLPAVTLKRVRTLSSSNQTDLRVARQNGDTIWIWNPEDNQFNVAYNFSLAVGDSVAVPLYYGDGDFKYSIDSIGTILIDGTTLRFQKISFFPANLGNGHCQSLIIETIGFINGECTTPDFQTLYGGHFFLDERNQGFVDGPEWAFCQYHNDNLNYQDGTGASCDGINSQQEPTEHLSSFQVQPNPFHEAFSIVTNTGQKPSSLRVFDAAGRLVLQTSSPSQDISTTALLSGLYFLEISFSNGTRQFCKAVKE